MSRRIVPSRCRHRTVAPHGSTVVLVLLVLSVSMALSYAVMRSQGMMLRIQSNSQRNGLARDAAVAGMNRALHHMQQANWAGVDTTLSGDVGPNERFVVRYTAGDPSLVPGSADYWRLPYRVTLLSTGFAADPGQPGVESTYQVQAVVELVPRALGAPPAEWDDIRQHTVYQLANEEFRIEVPCHVSGPVRLQGTFEVATPYSINHSPSRVQYLGDLNLMRNNGYPDLRPVTGILRLPYARNSAETLNLLNNTMGVATVDIAETPSSFSSRPAEVLSYRMYPGGPSYSAATLPSTVQGMTLEPDPATNPAGIFYRSGSVEVRTNSTIRGTVISRDQVLLSGGTIDVGTIDLLPLHGEEEPVQLPAVVARDFFLDAVCGATVRGNSVVHRDFEVVPGHSSTILVNMDGKMVVRRLRVRGRTNWKNAPWSTIYLLFSLQVNPSGGAQYLPLFAWAYGYQAFPILQIRPDTTAVRDHWQDLSEPIYVPHPDDGGLRWDLVSWIDSP